MSHLTILRTYAQSPSPSTALPPSILFAHSPSSLTIFDAYPKATFHFLILPRIVSPLTASDLASLKALLNRDKATAKDIIVGLREDALVLKASIEEEMVKRFGYKWDIWIGFHAVPSMEHLHLHVISSDLVSPSLKNKKHYNSFHPKLGFFLHLDDVLSWFDTDPSFYTRMSKLEKSEYEPLLKEDLCCYRCNESMKNMPTLKSHLQEEWDNETKSAKTKLEKAKLVQNKRKRNADENPTNVQAKTNEPSGSVTDKSELEEPFKKRIERDDDS
ncbi:hypothetical protein JAAARDRAFT_31735 [Jaapia argillacea MUCL 33604]|uniref:Aprataxin C2HE/C2H2/C2HC zinc finger domain-containing protein n=1 Tax=Jaapia argillacea MUCL 33604 TaxID=933084 RepID=A0A067Q115_9AGAM|nr:hypothetical protein JAAARDRAFT_31735 [Jaapia argillacea MUCL 33604]